MMGQHPTGYFIFCTILLMVLGDDKTVDYYEKLINDNLESAKNYILRSDAKRFSPHNASVKSYGSYDFIIIGAGSAGAVIANRLSEVKSWHILVLEAGTYGNNFSDIPAMFYVLHQSDYNWGYKGVPQKTACLAFQNSGCPYTRGCAVGGSSLINGLAYSRGTRKDYDLWASLGNIGWSYEEVLSYFKKSEDFHKTIPEATVEKTSHGQGGYLNVEYYRSSSEQAPAFVNAFKELGFNLTDYNGAESLGSSFTQFNSKYGRRVDTSNAFVSPVKNRTNLHISTNSFVTRIMIKNKRAIGVEFVQNGQIYQAFAKKEVILSAGTISSPQILMNSGIGPKLHLKKHNIKVVQDLPVGSKLRDHVSVSFSVCYEPKNISKVTLRDNIKQYLNGLGELTLAEGECIAFIQTSLEKIENYPDVEFFSDPGVNIQWVPLEEFKYQSKFQSKPACDNHFSLYVIALHIKSHGTIRLKSNNPFEYPLIHSNFYTDPDNIDINTLYEGIKFAQKLIETKSYRNMKAKLTIPKVKVCLDYQYLSKEYMLCYIKYFTFSSMHPISTCSMGVDPQRGAVVDPTLRVFGIKNLRVADASVMPMTITGHINAPTIMIGEKASDLIKWSTCKNC